MSKESKLILAILEADFNAARKEIARNDIDINAKDEEGFTALMRTSEGGHVDHRKILEELLKCPNIDVNIKNKDGDTALIIASKNGRKNKVEELLKCPNIDVNIKNKDGDTALTLASKEGYKEIVDILTKVQNATNEKDNSFNKEENDPNSKENKGWFSCLIPKWLSNLFCGIASYFTGKGSRGDIKSSDSNQKTANTSPDNATEGNESFCSKAIKMLSCTKFTEEEEKVKVDEKHK